MGWYPEEGVRRIVFPPPTAGTVLRVAVYETRCEECGLAIYALSKSATCKWCTKRLDRLRSSRMGT